MRTLQHRQLFAAAVFVAASLVLAIQLITPSPVMVSVGDSGTKVAELGGYFDYRDVGVVGLSACLLGASGTYLLLGAGSEPTTRSADAASRTDATPTPEPNGGSEPTADVLEARRQEWQETADELVNNEQAVYEAVLEADGVLAQNEIVDRTDLSKATVSRVLDNLESKNLAERKRRGMGNVVMLL